MSSSLKAPEVNIHIRARSDDRDLIDHAASVSGTNRSQFMLSSALKEATNVILDQTMIRMDAEDFQKVLEWMDKPASEQELEGMARLRAVRAKWANE